MNLDIHNSEMKEHAQIVDLHEATTKRKEKEEAPKESKDVVLDIHDVTFGVS
jgi:hypothetical protein